MMVEHPAVDKYDHSSLRFVIYAGAPMYRDIGYRCANSKRRDYLHRRFGKRCWNRTMPMATTVHANISRALIDTLTSYEGNLAAIYDEVVRLAPFGSMPCSRNSSSPKISPCTMRSKRSRRLPVAGFNSTCTSGSTSSPSALVRAPSRR